MANNHDIMALKILSLSKSEGNNKCADCHDINPKWTSWNLGIFICMNCAGLHRKLGVSVSKVKSITLDHWNEHYLESMCNIGNIKSNAYYEAQLPSSFQRSSCSSSTTKMETFIINKYVKKLFISTKSEDYPYFNKNKSTDSLNKKTSPPTSNAASHKNDLINIFCDYTPPMEPTIGSPMSKQVVMHSTQNIHQSPIEQRSHINQSLSNDQILQLFDFEPRYSNVSNASNDNCQSPTLNNHFPSQSPNTPTSLSSSTLTTRPSHDPYENIFK